MDINFKKDVIKENTISYIKNSVLYSFPSSPSSLLEEAHFSLVHDDSVGVSLLDKRFG